MIPIIESNSNVKYFAVSNVETKKDLEEFIQILPKKVNNFVKDLVNKQYDVEIKSKISWSFSGDGIWQKKFLSIVT